MSKYKEIKGFKVQTLASDTVASQQAGGSWASGGSLNTARFGLTGTGSSSTQTSGLVFGGDTGSGTRMVAVTESYNGTSFTEVNDLNTARGQLGGAGTTTAALAFSGEGPPPGFNKLAVTENYNGSSWTEVADLNTARYAGAGFGTSTAALMAGGTAGPGLTADTETWNGSSWTEVNNLNSATGVHGSGTTTDGIAIGSSPSANTGFQHWDGTNWTTSTSMNTARSNGNSVGNTTLALAFGGTTPASGKTEYWDGSAWTEVADMANSLNNRGPSGNTTACFAAGGSPTTANTEEWDNGPATFTQTNLGQVYYNSGSNAFKVTEQPVPGGTWASSGALNTGRGNAGSSGTQTANLFFGGDAPALTPETVTLTEQYNGTSWTEVADLNVARSQMFFSNQGTQTAALSATGNPVATKVESWNGSSWTESTALNTGRRNGASFGTQTAMLGTGGYNTAYQTLTEQWNGSSWTEVANCPDPKFISRGGGGTTTAGIIAGSYPNGDVDSSQLWNGSAWTNGPNINTGRSGIAFSATSQSSALAHGGGVGAPQAGSALCEFYNGTSWSELNDMAEASQSGCGAGSSVAGIHIGGYDPGSLTTTEEWTVPEANSTITVS